MEYPRGVEREYIAAIDIAAVFVASSNPVCGRGELTWFNRAYGEYRLRGGRSMSYGEARGRLRGAMMRRLVLVERVEYGADMLAEVFGAKF
jgi:hypothetical protein